jgi:hypothetical protein
MMRKNPCLLISTTSGLAAGPLTTILSFYAVPIVYKFNFPRVKRWLVDHWPSQWVQDIKNIVDVIHGTALEIYRAKQKAMEEGHGDDGKKDIISILSEIFIFFRWYSGSFEPVVAHSESECKCDR